MTKVNQILHRMSRFSGNKSKYGVFFLLILVSLYLQHPSQGTFAQEGRLDIDLVWRDGDTLPPGSSSEVNVTITNRFEDSVNLNFVGVRFEWMDEGIYLYGEESEKPRQLDPQGSITFSIVFTVPEEMVSGPHRIYLALVYVIFGEEVREVVQVEPPFNVIEIVTVTFTETKQTTIYQKNSEQTQPTRPTWVPAAVIIAGGVAVIMFLVYKRGEKRKEEQESG